MNDSTFLYVPSWVHNRVCKLSIRNGITLIDTMLISIPFSAEVFNMSVLHENGFAVIKGMDYTVYTQDGGTSFQSSVFQNNTGSSIDFTTSNIEVIKSDLAYVARNQGFYSSVDSCRTWQRVANLYGLAGNPRVSFANSDIGFLFNVRTIGSTQDF